ncbi:MAG: hypothetical protein LUC30_01320 [Clostridiales bacterium]|nr:hypothetical protein [Clostridiales bacterium]
MKRAYDVTLDGVNYRLRLTVGAQKRLIKQYGGNAGQVCIDALEDIGKMCDVLNEALHWTGSGNPQGVTGEDFYDLLVDEGYSILEGVPEVLFGTVAVSGILPKKQCDEALARLHGAMSDEDETEENPTMGENG